MTSTIDNEAQYVAPSHAAMAGVARLFAADEKLTQSEQVILAAELTDFLQAATNIYVAVLNAPKTVEEPGSLSEHEEVMTL